MSDQLIKHYFPGLKVHKMTQAEKEWAMKFIKAERGHKPSIEELSKSAEQANQLRKDANYRRDAHKRNELTERPERSSTYSAADYDKSGSYDPTDAYILALDLEMGADDED